jgi:hypothetical protein
MFVCLTCGEVILFESDKDEHIIDTGHSRFHTHELASPEEENEGYWQNELESLGIHPKRKNQLNDKDEFETLAENIKQVYSQEYKAAYDNDANDESKFDYMI